MPNDKGVTNRDEKNIVKLACMRRFFLADANTIKGYEF